MSKRKKPRKSLVKNAPWRRRASDLQQTLEQAEQLIIRGQAPEVLALLEPLLATYPRSGELHSYLGYARSASGDLWGAVANYERAIALSDNPGYLLPLASLYYELGLHGFALKAFRQLRKLPIEPEVNDYVRQTLGALEQDLQELADRLGVPVAETEKGLYHLDSGQRALGMGDFIACITANQQAIKLLPNWPPPRNNLSLGYFFNGQPQEAIATAREVLAKFPQNAQATGNAVRFLAWTGQEAEARAIWEQQQDLEPQNDAERLKLAEAAAVLEEDKQVYQLLKPLDRAEVTEAAPPGFSRQAQHLLAVAEANTGRHQQARRRFKALQSALPWVEPYLAALSTNQPGPGWAERFPYFHSTEFITKQGMEEFVKIMERQDKLSPQKFEKEIARFVSRFPQIVKVAEKLIWEERQVGVGIPMLAAIATPEAYAVLHRFGLSQAGDDDDRMQALMTLSEAGQIAEDETLRIWNRGRWQEIRLRQYEISDEPRSEYPAKVVKLMDRAMRAYQQNDDKKAEQLFRQVLALGPQVKEAYNNLAAVYSQRGEHERAKEMFQAALEVDPLYVFPRCNLAMYLIDEDDVKGAEAMLAPLAGVKRFHPQEMAFYSYVQARILYRKEEYDAARNALEAALEFAPDYEPARRLLDHLDQFSFLQTGFKGFLEKYRERTRARREKRQIRLTTANPPLKKALNVYPKDALTGMARSVIPWGGWTGLRKAELIDQLVGVLSDPTLLKPIIKDLRDEERAALRQVLAEGGSLDWDTFDSRYDNDLDESGSWNWHTPETTMGRLRQRGLLVEATVNDQLRVVIPAEVRQGLEKVLK